jgi:hypothetical protein
MVNEELIIFTNMVTKMFKYAFIGVVLMNSILFLVLILMLLIITLLFVCFPQFQNRIRERIAHYDRLIEQIAQNDGIGGNNFEENQPLSEEELMELQSFVKTDSFIDIYNSSPKSTKKSDEFETNYQQLEEAMNNTDNILIDLNRYS